MNKQIAIIISLLSVLTFVSSCGKASDQASTDEANNSTANSKNVDSINSEIAVEVPRS